MSRWLQDYHSFQSCANSASSCRLFNGAVFSLQKKSGSGKVALLEERNTVDLRISKFMFSHRKPLKDNVTVFDFVRHKMTYIVSFSITF
jgi:hypothetical protein